MDENDVQVRERLTAVESSVKSLHKRVDKQEDLLENIRLHGCRNEEHERGYQPP